MRSGRSLFGHREHPPPPSGQGMHQAGGEKTDQQGHRRREIRPHLECAYACTLGTTWTAPRLVQGRSAVLAGGRVEFGRLDGGEWIIRSWNLRIPNTLRYMQGAEVRTVLSHIHEEGGRVAELYRARGRRPDRRF